MIDENEMMALDLASWELACPDPDMRDELDTVLAALDHMFGLDLGPDDYDNEIGGTWDEEIEIDEGGGGPQPSRSSSKGPEDGYPETTTRSICTGIHAR